MEALSTAGARDVYSALAARDGATPDCLAEALAMSPRVVRHALDGLEELGLVSWVGELAFAVTPRTPLERVAREHQRRAALAQQAAHELGQLWSLHQGRADYIEIMPTMDAAKRTQARVMEESAEQIRALSIGTSRQLRMAEGLREALERDLLVRAVYGAEVLRRPAALAVVQECIAMGEQSRVFPTVPMNLLISDDSFAMMVVRVDSDRRADTIIIHPSYLLNSVVGVFEAFWRLAVPVATSDSAEPMDRESLETQRLLTNLAAGLTDKAIANDLEVSERTVRRRISQLQELLGSQTRFQLGVQVSRHGWL